MIEKELIFLDEFLCNLNTINKQILSFLQLKKQLDVGEKKTNFLIKVNNSREKARIILKKFKGSNELKKLLKKHNLKYSKAMNLFKEFESEKKARIELEKIKK
jgi:hypothetical protein